MQLKQIIIFLSLGCGHGSGLRFSLLALGFYSLDWLLYWLGSFISFRGKLLGKNLRLNLFGLQKFLFLLLQHDRCVRRDQVVF